LIENKFIPGEITLDEEGFIEESNYDEHIANKYVFNLIDYCFFG
jgi:hypothetical protein